MRHRLNRNIAKLVGWASYGRIKPVVLSPSVFVLFLVTMGLWLLLVLFASYHHEFWRDEVRALSLAISVSSPWELMTALRDEGHPGLWYVLLHLGHSWFGSNLILPGLSITIACATVALMLFISPFPLFFRFMFIFGVLPVYEYSVMARNYGISMLLMFLFASLYRSRGRHPLVLAILLAMLANSNVHSLLIAGLFTGIWLWDDYRSACARSLSRLIRTRWHIFALILLAAVLCVVTVMPVDSTVPRAGNFTLGQAATTIFGQFILPGQKFLQIFPARSLPLAASAMAWILVFGLGGQPHYALALLGGFVALGSFAAIVYPLDLRHQGIILGFMVSLYWMYLSAVPEALQTPRILGRWLQRLCVIALFVAFPIIFGHQVYKAYRAVTSEFFEQRSSNRDFARFIEANPGFRDAIVIAEPEYMVEALPYYRDNLIYLARESRFGTFFRFTSANRAYLSLGELLAVSRTLGEQSRKPVLIVLAKDLTDIDGAEAREIEYLNFRKFERTASATLDFAASTRKIAEFNSAKTDENFSVYELIK